MHLSDLQRRASIVSVCLPLLAMSAQAETERDLASHEHGASLLSVVLEGQSLYLEFESPWENLVGFEHEPSTAEQQLALSEAASTLGNSEALFTINDEANCTAQPAAIDSTLSLDDDASLDQHDETAEHHEEAIEHHEEDSEHHDEHSEHHDEGSQHSEVVVVYEFVCEAPSRLEHVNVAFFSTWSGIDDIDVSMAGPGGQSATELNAGSPTFDLSEIR